MEFFQDGPELSNQYTGDRVLKQFLSRILPLDMLKKIEPDLIRFGERVVTDILKLAQEAEAQEPIHVPYSPWGKRIDEIRVAPAWQALDRVAAEEGIVALGYKREFAEYSRLYQFAKLYLFHPSSAIYSCPLAMTDGAARVLEVHGSTDLKERAYKRLTSMKADEFWTSGQWMTERAGGSDVSGTSTIARNENGQWRLYGVKWFTSATTSQMAMALAKIEGEDKLSLFYVELRNTSGDLQNIQVNRLKDKLGTKALPTAELTLSGTPAVLVGERGKGVKTIATLFNITRVYNACCAVGYMRRGIALATSYAQKRVAFGKKLIDHGLHVETLAEMQVRFEASFIFTFHAVQLLGREETGKTTADESACLRLLIPLVKLFTAKEGVAVASEALESFGGAGYIEDTGLPALLRNAQVLAIWEGTTNVLSLDSLRAIRKENAGPAFLNDVAMRLSGLSHPEVTAQIDGVKKALGLLANLLSQTSVDEEDLNTSARGLAMGLSKTYIASLLLERAEFELKQGDKRSLIVAKRWIRRGLFDEGLINQDHRKNSLSLIS